MACETDALSPVCHRTINISACALCVCVCVFQGTCWPDFTPPGWVLQQTVTESGAVCKTHVRGADLWPLGDLSSPRYLRHTINSGRDTPARWAHRSPRTFPCGHSSLWSSACSAEVPQLILLFLLTEVRENQVPLPAALFFTIQAVALAWRDGRD